MLICVLSLCCGGVAADVRYDFALLPLYGVRLVTYILPVDTRLAVPREHAASIGGWERAPRFHGMLRREEMSIPSMHVSESAAAQPFACAAVH